jgi:hypothetical protein
MASSLSAFLGEIGRHQLLTPEQELTLGRKVQAMVVLQERCSTAGGSGPACDYSDLERRTLRTGERAKRQISAWWSTSPSATRARALICWI